MTDTSSIPVEVIESMSLQARLELSLAMSRYAEQEAVTELSLQVEQNQYLAAEVERLKVALANVQQVDTVEMDPPTAQPQVREIAPSEDDEVAEAVSEGWEYDPPALDPTKTEQITPALDPTKTEQITPEMVRRIEEGVEEFKEPKEPKLRSFGKGRARSLVEGTSGD